MDTIVSDKMTNRDTQDILMGKLIDMEEISHQNHTLVMKSLEAVADIITTLNKRVSELEAKVSNYE